MPEKLTREELEQRINDLEKSEFELKQQLETLRKSDEILKTIVEKAPLLMDAFDEKGRCLLWSRQCQKVLGWTINEINAHDDFLSVVYTDPDVADKVRRAVIDEPDGKFQEWHPVTKDDRTLSQMWANFRLPDGTLIGLGYDITDQNQSKKALQENEEEIRGILDATDETIGLIDRQGIVITTNKTACGRLNTTKEELVGRVIYDFFPPDVAKERKQKYETVFDTGVPISFVDIREGMTYEQNVFPIHGIEGQVEKVVIFARDITKRNQAEEALKESEANLRNLIRALPDLVWLKDRNGVYLSCNSRFEDFFGAKEKDIIGKTDYDFVDKELADFFIENDQLAITKGRANRNEEKITFAVDGHSEILDTIKTPLFWNDGHFAGVLGIGRDITERKQAEEMLRYRIDLEKLIADISTLFVGISSDRMDEGINQTLQLIGQFTQIDRSYLFMLSEDGLVLNNTHEWCAEGIPPQIKNLQGVSVNDITWWMEKLDRNEIIHIPIVDEMLDPAGIEKTILQQQNIQSLLVVPLVLGTRLIGFIGFDSVQTGKSWTEEDKLLLRTIAEIIAQKLESMRIEAAHRENEEKYRKLFENAQIGLFRTRVDDGLILEANQRLADMFGYDSRNELIGHHSVKDYYADPEERLRMIAELRKKGEINNYETRFRKKNGMLCWLRLSGTLYEKEGYFEGVMSDITENKEAAAEREQLEEQYRQAQKVEAIGRLAGGVAHDMNNLLTPILGYGELLMADFSHEDRRRKSVEQMVRAGYSARDLVRQLLAFSRKQTLDYKPMDLNATIKGFEKLLRHTIREDIALTIQTSPDMPIIKADIGQIEQVIMNLCVNAQDAMPSGGGLMLETAFVEISEEEASARPGTKPGSYVMLSCSDTGVGIDVETQKHIFEPFFSTKGARGTGLGLATVYGIVKQHGGNIWAYSELGEGTIFKIYLPVSEIIQMENEHQKELSDDLNGSETILLVEDNKQVRDLGYAILTQKGYNVLTAKNGTEALVHLAVYDGTVHLLLTDVVMPRMNGKELVTKAVQNYSDLKVLYMSGYDNDLVHHHGIMDGNTAFIQKPFTVQTLAVKVREVLGSA